MIIIINIDNSMSHLFLKILILDLMAKSPEDEIICKCLQVSEETIRSCIAAGNLTTVEQVTRACEAGGGCHSCHILLDLFIDQHLEKSVAAEPVSSISDEKLETAGMLGRIFNRFKPSETIAK